MFNCICHDKSAKMFFPQTSNQCRILCVSMCMCCVCNCQNRTEIYGFALSNSLPVTHFTSYKFQIRKTKTRRQKKTTENLSKTMQWPAKNKQTNRKLLKSYTRKSKRISITFAHQFLSHLTIAIERTPARVYSHLSACSHWHSIFCNFSLFLSLSHTMVSSEHRLYRPEEHGYCEL